MTERDLKVFSTLDLYISSFLALHGLEPRLEVNNGKVVFTFPATDDLYRLIARYNSDEKTPANSFVTTVKMLRGQMLSMRGQRK